MSQEGIARKISDFLEADPEGYRLFTHAGAGYCYLFRHEDVGSGAAFEVSPLEALDEGWLTVNEEGTGVRLPGGDMVPLQIDWVKVRRRVEDTLRKLEDRKKLYKVARELNVKLT